MSPPLGWRQSASGSPEHVLVPTADCPEDISHIIQPNQWLQLAQRPEQRQLEIEYRGDVSQMKLSCHSGQMGDETKHSPHEDTTFHTPKRCSHGTHRNGRRLFNVHSFSLRQLNWLLYSAPHRLICLLNWICCSNSSDGCKYVFF